MIRPVQNLWSPSTGWQRATHSVLDVWRFNLDQIEDRDWSLLNHDEIQRANRFVVPSKTLQFVCARSKVRKILGRYLGVSPEHVDFHYSENGKPRLPNSANLQINISHSRKMGLLAIWSNGELGIDIEYRAKHRNFDSLAEFAFSNDEKMQFRKVPSDIREAIFYQTWTRKEAYLKALGTGLHLSSRSFSVSIDPDCPAKILECTSYEDDIGRWSLLDVPINDSYTAALCYWGVASGLRLWNEVKE